MIERLALLVVAATFAAGPAVAAEPSPPPAVVPGDAGTFTLRDGGTIVGRVVLTDESGVVVELTDESQLRFPPGAVTGARDLRVQAGEGTRVRATLRDGKVIEGSVAARAATGLTLLLDDGNRMAVPWTDVRAIEYRGAISTGPSWAGAPAEGPARNRTLFAPTAFLLRPAELQLSLTGVVQPTFTAGVFSFLGASAWTVIPVMQAADHPGTGAVLLDGGFSPLPWLHLLGGVQAVYESGGVTVAPVVAVTAGDPRLYVNVALAPSPVGAARSGQFDKGAIAVSGGVAFASWGMALAESWFGKAYDGSVSVQLGAALRAWWGVVGGELGATWATGNGGTVFASLVLDVELGDRKEQR